MWAAIAAAKNIYSFRIGAVWACEMGRFAVQNGPDGRTKRAVLEREIDGMDKVLEDNGLERGAKEREGVNNVYIVVDALAEKPTPQNSRGAPPPLMDCR